MRGGQAGSTGEGDSLREHTGPCFLEGDVPISFHVHITEGEVLGNGD